MKEKKVKFVAHEGGDEMNLFEAMDYVAERIDLNSEKGLKFLEDKAEEATASEIEYRVFASDLARSEGKVAVATVGVFVVFLIMWVFKLFGVGLLGSATDTVLGIISLTIIILSSFNIGIAYTTSRARKKASEYGAYSNLCAALLFKSKVFPDEKKAKKTVKKNTPKKESKDGKGKARKA